MKNIIAAIALLITTTGALAQNNITKSKITFELKNLGIKTGGTIGGVQGSIVFTPENLAASKIEATADVNTINTDNDRRDEHLKKDDYFDVAKYPQINMSSVSFKKKSGNSYTGVFNITIKNKTKQIDVPFTIANLSTGQFLKGTFKINRKDFGIGGSSMTMSDDVTVAVEAETTK